MRGQRWFGLAAACVLLLLTLAPAAAQTRLFPGVSIQGRIASDTPSIEYNFDALAGDRVRARVMGTQGLDASLAVLDLDNNVLAAGNTDPWSPDPTDGFVAYTIPADGAYKILISAEMGTSGEYLLQFEQASSVEPLTLGFEQTTRVPVLQDAGSLWLDFEAQPNCPTVMMARPDVDPSANPFGYLINVYDERGGQVGQLNGERPVENRLEFAAGSGRYWAEIKPWRSTRDGELLVSLTCAVGQPACAESVLSLPDAEPLPEIPPGLFSARGGGLLAYGESLQGDVGQAAPFLAYQFEAQEGDELALQVTGQSFGFNPALYVIAPSNDLIGFATDSPGAFKETDAVFATIAPESGAYVALVGSEDQGAGTFIIRLIGQTAAAPIPLPFEEAVTVEPAQLEGLDQPLLRYTFDAQPDCSTMVALQGQGADILSLGSYVRRAQGNPVGRLRVSDVTGAALVVPAGSGGYEVLLAPPDQFAAIEPLTLTVTCQLASQVCEAAAGNPLPPEVELPPFTPAPTPETACGDGICSGWENEFACPGDCDVCGNGVCGPFESYDTCRTDCPRPRSTPIPTSPPEILITPDNPAICGDGWCMADEAVTCCGDCGTCPTDVPAFCGDGTCDPFGLGENPETCPQDCGQDFCPRFCPSPNEPNLPEFCFTFCF
jgi:hypothetical protein